MSKGNLITLILCIFMVGAGYVILSGEYITPGQGALSAEQVRDRVVDASDSVSSYRFRMDLIWKRKTEGDALEVESNGSVDLQSKRMHILEDDGNRIQEIYLINDTLYTSMFGEWMKEVVPGGQHIVVYPNGQYVIRYQTEMIKNADVELTGEEKVDGVDCYVLSVSPDMVKALSLDALGLREDEVRDVLNGIESVTLTDWVSKDDCLIRKSRMKVVEVDGRWTDTTTVFYEYNKHPDIELPGGAVNATEM
ncbi:MAG: hypothetical protein KAU03_06770 [Candidatus Altiarchaeales archaeon]|nr:hypothetical protein [Candidatus Altiarchaeales archaeon]